MFSVLVAMVGKNKYTKGILKIEAILIKGIFVVNVVRKIMWKKKKRNRCLKSNEI